jgi:tetratricopeptide (TPR) repeat protein
MADVILHEYVEQLRAHVQARRLSDAFTLGQHILRYYPKHIETYVVLAQASLEANDLGAATDLFRRVLSADPENVLALAGMALIHENQDRNDEALWYLERAYEIQPTNDELRRELVRVRELYYGASNERLELTPGALARIFARQGQYAAAINEFRRLLRHESKRYDARVALAETLFRAGRADEAAQLAQNIMQDAPYSLKPNLILGALWSDNAVAEGQQYLSRAQALDPEQRVARDLIGARFANLPPPRLPALQDHFASMRPDTQAIGVVSDEPTAPAYEVEPETFADETEPYVVPDDIEERLRAAELQAQNETTERAVPEKPDIPLAAVAMGTAATGAMLAARETEQGEAPAAPETADATLAEIAAAEQANVVPTPPAETTAPRTRSRADSIPTDAIAAAAAALATSIAVDKLKQPAPARRTHPALPKVRPVISGASDKLPAWLRLSATPAQASASFDAPAPTQAERIAPIVTPETQTAPDERPDWLVHAQAPATPSAASETDLPDWLRTAAALDLAQQSVTTPPAETPISAPIESTVAPATAELPEWLREPGQTKSETTAVEAVTKQITDAQSPAWQQDAQRETASAPAPGTSPHDAESLQSENVLPTEAELQIARADAPPVLTQNESPESVAAVSAAETESPAPAEPEPAAPAEKPLDAKALIEVARAKQTSGDIKGALDSYERAMHRRPNHLDEIIVDLQELMKQPNLPPAAHRLLGEAYAMAGRFKESLEQYRLAMGK